MINSEKATLLIVSGGFDPLHSGHLDMIEEAFYLRGFCTGIIVLLNSDAWLTRKKGKPFMPFAERKRILESLEQVTAVVEFNDSDDTCIDGLKKVKELYPQFDYLFCNGGDRTADNIPETNVKGIACLFGIGGNKTNDSSLLTREERVWGYFVDLYEVPGTKVKELTLNPAAGISCQRHNHRSELWFVREGKVNLRYSITGPSEMEETIINTHDTFIVEQGAWHQLYNTSGKVCKIIEIQYGDQTVESDIERTSYYTPPTND